MRARALSVRARDLSLLQRLLEMQAKLEWCVNLFFKITITVYFFYMKLYFIVSIQCTLLVPI